MSEKGSGNMQLIMVPTLGFVYTLLFIGVAIALILASRFHRALRYVCLVLALIQIFLSVFLWFNPTTWQFNIQLLVVALFGIFALINLDQNSDHVFWYLILSVINTGYVIGIFSFMHPVDFEATVATEGLCEHLYDEKNSSGHCRGYANFLQLVAFVVLIIQPLQTFLLYVLYKNGGSSSATFNDNKLPGRYDAIGESHTPIIRGGDIPS
eukprot:TRINITY_DN11372_c0_g1_i1.p1 TRINITY_DN11372_c0_g1~~TRINITY_DN11372_c0_g1_i1.p1  ORF type:complete len:233 (+),score=35.79 TRINITY_DN11372_c0_g1_i1:71-700(+)